MNFLNSIRIGACLLALTLSWKVLTGAQTVAARDLPPLPLYTLESDAIAAGKGMETAQRCGLQYLTESSDSGFVGAADVRASAECVRVLSGPVSGEFGPGARNALSLLQDNDRVKAGRYETRMIHASPNWYSFPSIRLVAVWLKSLQKSEDLIYPLQSATIPPNTLYGATEFLRRLRPLLANVQWSSDYDLHGYFVDRFLESEGNGISRVYQPPMSLRESMRLRITSRDSYKLESFDLIGVGKHPDPVAFLGRTHQRVALLRQTRPLTKFETRAVAELTAGEDVTVQNDSSGRVVIGALRAKEDCLRCHGGKTGDVLGALSYRLTPANLGVAEFGVRLLEP